MLIKNAKIYTMEEAGIIEGDILIQKGKIVKVGNVEESDDEVIDASGKFVFPGMVEAHCHLGMEESAIGFEGDDVNETTDPITPVSYTHLNYLSEAKTRYP